MEGGGSPEGKEFEERLAPIPTLVCYVAELMRIPSMPWDDPDKRLLLRNITKDNCCLFLGAGVSSATAGLAKVGDLQKKLLDGLRKSSSSLMHLQGLSLAALAGYFETRHGRDALLTVLWDALNSERINLKSSSGVRLLTDFRWRAIYTTNYDPLIEIALREGNIAARVLSSNRDVQKLEPFEVPVIKLHGCINTLAGEGENDNAPLVITESDYVSARHRQNRDLLFSRLGTDLSRRTFIFVGYSMKDESVRGLCTSVFQSLTEANRRNRDRPGTRKHFMVRQDLEEPEMKFWASYGIQGLHESLDEFVEALVDYRSKVLPTAENEYFPHQEYVFITSGAASLGCPKKEWTLPLWRSQYDSATWELSHIAFSREQELPGRFLYYASKNVYVGAALLSEAGLKLEQKTHLAGRIVDHLIASRSETGEAEEMSVSSLPLIWHFLAEPERDKGAKALVSALESSDYLTVYKVNQVALEIGSNDLWLQIISFLRTHIHDGENALLSADCRMPIARFLRQVGYILLPMQEADEEILDLLDETTNPLLIWELGVLVFEKCRWNKKLKRVFLRRALQAADSDSVHGFMRYMLVLERGRKIFDIDRKINAFWIDCRDLLLSNSAGEGPFIDRLRLTLEASRSVVTSEDFMTFCGDYLENLTGDRKSVAFFVPSLARRMNDRESIKSCFKAIETTTDPFIAQPLLFVLCGKLFREGKAQDWSALVSTLEYLWRAELFRADDWARLLFMRVLGLLLHKSTAGGVREGISSAWISKLLEEVAASKEERLTIRGMAWRALSRNLGGFSDSFI